MTILPFSWGNQRSIGYFNVNPMYPLISLRWKTLRCYRIQVVTLYHNIKECILASSKLIPISQTVMLSALGQGLSMESAWYRWACTDVLGVILIIFVLCCIDTTAFFWAPEEDKIEAVLLIVFCAVFLAVWSLRKYGLCQGRNLCHRCLQMLLIPWGQELCFPFFTVSATDVLRGSKKRFLQYIKLSYSSQQNPSWKLPHSIH